MGGKALHLIDWQEQIIATIKESGYWQFNTNFKEN